MSDKGIEVLSMLIDRGYDSWIDKNDDIIILEGGFISNVPLANALSILNATIVHEGVVIPLPFDLNTVVTTIIELHKGKRDIANGLYDDAKPLSKTEVRSLLTKLISLNTKNEK